MIHLNGWQRLFAIATVLWLLLAASLATWVFTERKQLAEVSSLIGMIKRETPEARFSAYMRSLGTVPLGQFKGVFEVQNIAVRENLLLPARVDYLALLAHGEYASSQSRRDDMFYAFTLWLLVGTFVPALIYALGLLVAWVRRGFAKGAREA